ncbi:hypothetical protein [Acetatifactor muris]|uniref:hypothetical protein n=1 Tax=Acetatifactor muris TaxID=879566 RepID=UPI0023F034E5|nr:hypothetical protein [Acetatifactor muris]
MKLKIRSEEEHQYNSPWNIAEEFKVDMELSSVQTRNVLEEYESNHRTGMDTTTVAKRFTNIHRAILIWYLQSVRYWVNVCLKRRIVQIRKRLIEGMNW